MRFRLSDLTRERFARFRRLRRAYVSLWILGGAFFLSLFSELLANDHPLYLRYRGESYFPIFAFHSGETFGGPHRTEADYPALRKDPAFKAAGGYMLFPPIPHGPFRNNLELPGTPPHAPSREHLLGTDETARDVFARLLYGFRISLVFALTLSCIGAVLGIVIGGVQGYFGGKVDIAAQRFIEIWSSLPLLYIVILLGSIYGTSFGLLLFIMALFEWIGMSYYMRGEFFKQKGQAYVKVARALGFGHLRIFFRHLLPNSLTPVITLLPFAVIGGISSLTALDFLGFGLPPPAPSWGDLLAQGLRNLEKPWLAVSTIAALFTTLLLATFIGEGVREAFDPKAGQRVE